jgi:hypothetical protein
MNAIEMSKILNYKNPSFFQRMIDEERDNERIELYDIMNECWKLGKQQGILENKKSIVKGE